MKCWQMPLAISRDIENVVVVVVVTIRVGSLESAARVDWENLRAARLEQASSLWRCQRLSLDREGRLTL